MIDLKVLQDISNVQRFSGDFLFHPENISTHSLEMCILCINFSEIVSNSDKKDMCYRCVLHDLDEAIASDVPRQLKYQSKELKDLISSTSASMLKPFISNELFKDFNDAKDDTVNGFLVGLADRLQCFLKLAKEVKFYGNKSLSEDYYNFLESIPTIKQSVMDNKSIISEDCDRLLDYIDKIVSYY